MNVPAFNTDPLVFIQELLSGHGLTAERQLNRLIVDDGQLLIEAEVYDHDTPSGFTVSLEVHALSDALDGNLIVECFAGFGNSRDEAISDAFRSFMLGSFHVLIESLTSHSCQREQAEIEHWRHGDAAWQVFSGPLLTRHSGESLLSPAYPEILSKLEQLFIQSTSAGPHWIRVFVGAYHRRVQTIEVLLDNEPWEQGMSVLASADWTCADEYQSIRHFILALPDARLMTN